jgi:uncharacterized membrane protein
VIPRKHLVLIALIILAEGVFTAAMYPRMPQRVPTHFGFSGEADRYGSPLEVALFTPLATVAMVGLLAGLPLLGPFRANFEKFKPTYGRIAVTVIGALAAVQVVFVLAAMGVVTNVTAAMCVVMGLLLAVLGNWMGKIRRNFYVGIRTPWTLASDEVWRRTHRLGGRLLMVAGLAGAAAGLAAPPLVAFVLLFGALIAAALWSVVYSLVVYRSLGGRDDLSPSPRET